MLQHWQRAVTVLLLIGLLGACASPYPTAPVRRTSPPAGFAPWVAQGKVAVTTPRQGATASFIWRRQTAAQEQVQFSGPLGIGGLDVARSGDTVIWLNQGRGEPLDTLPVNGDVASVLADLPFAQLGDSLLGAELPDFGWTVEITDWQTVDGWEVPSVLSLTDGSVRARIVVTAWQLQ